MRSKRFFRSLLRDQCRARDVTLRRSSRFIFHFAFFCIICQALGESHGIVLPLKKKFPVRKRKKHKHCTRAVPCAPRACRVSDRLPYSEISILDSFPSHSRGRKKACRKSRLRREPMKIRTLESLRNAYPTTKSTLNKSASAPTARRNFREMLRRARKSRC